MDNQLMSHQSTRLSPAIPNKTILLNSLPIALSYIFLGLGFGTLFVQKGGTPVTSFIFSLTTFSGAAQFASIEYIQSAPRISGAGHDGCVA